MTSQLHLWINVIRKQLSGEVQKVLRITEVITWIGPDIVPSTFLRHDVVALTDTSTSVSECYIHMTIGLIPKYGTFPISVKQFRLIALTFSTLKLNANLRILFIIPFDANINLTGLLWKLPHDRTSSYICVDEICMLWFLRLVMRIPLCPAVYSTTQTWNIRLFQATCRTVNRFPLPTRLRGKRLRH